MKKVLETRDIGQAWFKEIRPFLLLPATQILSLLLIRQQNLLEVLKVE